MHPGTDKVFKLGHHMLIGMLLAVALSLLTGCSGESRPFSKTQAPSGRTAPPISIVKMNGIPAQKAGMLANLIQEAAATRDIAITVQDFGDSWKMSGDFVPQTEPGGSATLVYAWTLQDGKGRTMHQISGVEPVGPVAGDVWSTVPPDSLRRIAGFTAENLASRLAQLGFATQSAGLIPPSDAYARAGPNAEKELDYETLYGHRAALGGPLADGRQVAAAPQVAGTPALDDENRDSARTPVHKQASAAPATAEARATPTARHKSSGNTIRGVAITGVKGSPGKGNAELATAMRRALEKAGWPVYDAPRPDALNIAGKVTLSKSRGATQKVALAWTVTSPSGESLGTIRQANDVAAGSLDQGWGETAGYAAQAGAEGIFELVGKLR